MIKMFVCVFVDNHVIMVSLMFVSCRCCVVLWALFDVFMKVKKLVKTFTVQDQAHSNVVYV